MKISIITATWNCSSTIIDCLESVASQSYGNREHILIDGGSTDGTIDLLQPYLKQLAVYISEPDSGIYDALNKGIKNVCGDVVGFLHADDLYAHPDVLAHIAAIFENNPDVCAVYGDLQYVSKQDTSVVVRDWKSSAFSPRQLAWGWMPPHPTLYIKLEWYERIGGFDTSYKVAADYFSILQLFSAPEFKSFYLSEVLVKMRIGGTSNGSFNSILRKSLEDWNALQRTKAGAFFGVGALMLKNLRKISQLKINFRL